MSNMMQRIGILIITLIFVGTTIGVGLYAVFFNDTSNNQQISQEELDRLLQEQNNKENNVNITCSTDPSINYTATPPLQDTLLPNYTPTGNPIEILNCVDIVIGNGAEVQAGDTVTAHYTGALASNGNIFQSSYDTGQPIPFGLDQVISGWTNGVPGMKEGGKRRIFIPANQAYGPTERTGIPANSDLIFDIEIVKIGQ